MNIYFLGSTAALTKRFFKANTESGFDKSSYPLTKNFTSYKESVTNLNDLYKAINAHGDKGHCLVKGTLQFNLDNEPRAGATKTEIGTQWLCLDLDRAPYKDAEEFIALFDCFTDVSYIVQHSSSQGAPGTEGTLSAHIFILLDQPIAAPSLKAWLMNLNLTEKTLKQKITLTRSAAALHWPLDITTCQNDKLLYIAPPIFDAPLKPFIKAADRIQLIAKKLQTMPTGRIPKLQIEAQRKEAHKLRNQLRGEQHMDPIRSSALKHIGEYEVQSKPGVISSYEVFDDESTEFIRFNFNGGDSKAYYHTRDNFELIHNFKGEPSYYTKEILPDYYKECVGERKREQQAPTKDGESILAFIDFDTQRFYLGTWNPAKQDLILKPTDSEAKIHHFLQDKGKYIPEHLPSWNVMFDPTSNIIVDEDARQVNTYVPTPYMRKSPFRVNKNLDRCPLIKATIMSAVSGNEINDTYEHFLNWLAVIFQYRVKTTTAWLLNGTEGTGKGVMVNDILAPIIGQQYVKSVKMSTLADKFNDYLTDSLIVFYDEMDNEAMNDKKGIVSADVRNMITEDKLTIRGMHRSPMQMMNYTNFIFGSNRNQLVEISERDRRFNVGLEQDTRLIMTRAQVKVDIPQELEWFTDYIMTRKADMDVAASILKTEARRTMISNNKTSIDIVCDAIREGDFPMLWDSRTDLRLIADTHGVGGSGSAYQYNELMIQILKEFQTNGTPYNYKEKKEEWLQIEMKHPRESLYFILSHNIGNIPQSPAKFSRFVAHHNLPVKVVWINNTTVKGREIQWKAPKKWVMEKLNEINKKTLKLVK